MATLQKIRNKAGFLIAVIGIALLAFILGDLLTSGSTLFRKSQDKVFEVNGKVISTEEYFTRVTEWENFQKMMSGESSLDENASLQIKELVYQQMVRECILDDQAKKLGLTVSKEEINDLVHGENISPLLQQLPLFVDPKTGIYDREALTNFFTAINTPTASLQPEEKALVQQYKSMWLFIENLIKYQRLEEKYRTLLASAVMVNDMEAKTSFDLSQQNADLTYVVQNYYTIPDTLVTVEDSEIRAFYEKHKKNFKLNTPIAKITYFIREIAPSDEDFAEVEAQAMEAAKKLAESTNPSAVVADYSETPYHDVYLAANVLTESQRSFVSSANIGDMYGPVREGNSFQIYKLIDKIVAPDSVRLRMIVVPTAGAGEQDSLVRHFVDSVFTVIKGGKPFAQVANELNPQSNGGDAGWVREIDIASVGNDFVQTVFSMQVGEVRKISVPGQSIIVQVEEKTKPVTKYKLAVINMPVVVSERTSNNVDNELNQFLSLPDVGKKFTELAKQKGYAVVPNYTISSTDFSIAQIPGSRQVIQWAFNEKEKGAVKKFDLTNLRIVARLDNVIPAGTAPLSEVATVIRSQLVREKKAEKIITELKSKNLSSLADYAEEMNTQPDTVRFVNFNTRNIAGLGFEPVLNAYSAFAPLHKLMGPAKGNMGVFVVNVDNRTQGTETYDPKIQKNSMQSEITYRLQMQSMEVLKDKLEVKDNRYRFY
ncbi:peptidylprolyl isomerase [Anaerorudis cellulosivorans]|uniref:peptidylprolyl isomerase n=1 Tax=Anaerorudis cellulosivorans TaxID=3397862 RepID=UPI0022207EA8|nr:peptidylprolyl isomerase [Seramator thermalis]MCW1735817.1 SurA N-terminal domain-containing protein [Seramator thermalis]